MSCRTVCDVAIIGAGPSGSAAALRLLALGRDVVLIDRLAFPRPQIGESLSPGVWEILKYLDALPAIASARFLTDLPARVAWDNREPRLFTAAERGPGVIVDRADFDDRLAALAETRGARRFQPARVKCFEGGPGSWRLWLEGREGSFSIDARLVIDARGRSGGAGGNRVSLGPATHAIFTEVAPGLMPVETLIEAAESGWLWGSPLPDGRFRVMAFVDTERLKRDDDHELLFRALLANTRLFAAAASAKIETRLKTRCATPYFNKDFWLPGMISIGETAVALDPLSSSGVEKSMRLALQAVIAINTVLEQPSSEPIAREFYATRLLESAAAHTNWTQGYYAQAWPGTSHAFWRLRSSLSLDQHNDHAEAIARFEQLRDALARDSKTHRPGVASAHKRSRTALSRANLETPVTLSPRVRLVSTPCAVADFVELRPAVAHPALARPVAFLEGIELAPLLRVVSEPLVIGDLLMNWTRTVSIQTALPILDWLVNQEILEVL
jgi:flavin-dependent dehydrogenase